MLRALGAFSGLVTGLFWLAALAPGALRSGAGPHVVLDYLGAVLAAWTATVIPSLLVPGLHAVLTDELAVHFGRSRARMGSALLVLAAWPVAMLVRPELRPTILFWGAPLAILLFLYGWMRGGMIATDDRGTPLDRALERSGIGITALFILGFVGTVGWAWSRAMFHRG
jgi:hypothetical protein